MDSVSPKDAPRVSHGPHHSPVPPIQIGEQRGTIKWTRITPTLELHLFQVDLYLPPAIERLIRQSHKFEAHCDEYLVSSIRSLFRTHKHLNPLTLSVTDEV